MVPISGSECSLSSPWQLLCSPPNLTENVRGTWTNDFLYSFLGMPIGGSYFHPRMSNVTPHLGVYLALTNARLKGADLRHTHMATHYVRSEFVCRPLTTFFSLLCYNFYSPYLILISHSHFHQIRLYWILTIHQWAKFATPIFKWPLRMKFSIEDVYRGKSSIYEHSMTSMGQGNWALSLVPREPSGLLGMTDI